MPLTQSLPCPLRNDQRQKRSRCVISLSDFSLKKVKNHNLKNTTYLNYNANSEPSAMCILYTQHAKRQRPQFFELHLNTHSTWLLHSVREWLEQSTHQLLCTGSKQPWWPKIPKSWPIFEHYPTAYCTFSLWGPKCISNSACPNRDSSFPTN